MPTFDFDFAHIAVPFAMRPGLARLSAGATHFTTLHQTAELRQEKAAVWQSGQALHCAEGFDSGLGLQAIAQKYTIENIATNAHGYWTKGQFDQFFAEFDPKQLAQELSMAVEEDFCIIDNRPTSPHAGSVPFMCVCSPSHWAPEDKVGQSFFAIHAPVAENTAIQRASGQLLSLATSGQAWERFVWTLSPSARHDQHPKRHQRPQWPAGFTAGADQDSGSGQRLATFASNCYLRAERQTLFPVPDAKGLPSGMAVFTIRVMLKPLALAVNTPAKAKQLHASLASMSAAVLDYKGLGGARSDLLAWLETGF